MWARRILFRPVLSRLGGALRYLAVGGAAMNPNVARRWQEMGVISLQGYGATETSPVVAFTRVEHNRIGTVARGVSRVEVRIAPDGEILVHGPNVFKGYWERPDATAAVLEDGWYHTGDHGILDEDGFLTLQGRKKDMLVMPDGTKVHPDDIEQVLTRDPRVRDATVVGLERAEGDVQVHAVLILRDDGEADEVVREANRQLGGHQQIPAGPRGRTRSSRATPSMKVLKHEVLSWIQARSSPNPPHRLRPPPLPPPAPSPDWCARSTVSAADAVVPEARLSSDLGIDSLGRVELLSLVEEELGVYIDDGELDPDETVGWTAGEGGRQRRRRRRPPGGHLRLADESAGGRAAHRHPADPPPADGGAAVSAQGDGARAPARAEGTGDLRSKRSPAQRQPDHPVLDPARRRRKLSVAAALDGIFKSRFRGFWAAVIGNAFPLAREGAVRRSLDLLGARLDRGYSILIYPEGKLTVGGPLQEFESGTGLVAIHGAIPVVPMRLKVNRYSRFDKGTTGTSLRGDVEVVFGKPIRFPVDDDPNRATAEIRAAVEAL